MQQVFACYELEVIKAPGSTFVGGEAWHGPQSLYFDLKKENKLV